MGKPAILTLDDDTNVLRAVERDLRRQYGRDYRIARADSGSAALELLEALKRRGDPSALFLVDQRMPGMNGVEFLEKAIDAGVTRLEVASFEPPPLVPQLEDAEELIAALPEHDGVSYIGLLMNERGLDRALATKVQEVGMVVVATDTYNRKNQGVSSEESVAAWLKIAQRAKKNGRVANVMISSAFGCPYEGEVPVERVGLYTRADDYETGAGTPVCLQGRVCPVIQDGPRTMRCSETGRVAPERVSDCQGER